ncbi:MAG: hypothetical protein V1797_03830, partial [Pseudomonadota bacterium]
MMHLIGHHPTTAISFHLSEWGTIIRFDMDQQCGGCEKPCRTSSAPSARWKSRWTPSAKRRYARLGEAPECEGCTQPPRLWAENLNAWELWQLCADQVRTLP